MRRCAETVVWGPEALWLSVKQLRHFLGILLLGLALLDP